MSVIFEIHFVQYSDWHHFWVANLKFCKLAPPLKSDEMGFSLTSYLVFFLVRARRIFAQEDLLFCDGIAEVIIALLVLCGYYC